MSTGPLCLRCRRYLDDCRCVHPVPSDDGKVPRGWAEGSDWRAAEYSAALGLAMQHARWCPHRSSPAFGCYCDYGKDPELADPRPEVVEEAVARALWRIDEGGKPPLGMEPPSDVMDEYRHRARERLGREESIG